MPKPEVTTLTLTSFDEFGAERTKPFIQGMLNRFGFGAARYGRRHEDMERDSHPEDMVNTAIMRALAGLEYGQRESLIDAANFLVLAYTNMPEAPAWDGHSPGVVYGGIVDRARGMFAPNNGKRFRLDHGFEEAVTPSNWAEHPEHHVTTIDNSRGHPQHFTGGPPRWDVV